MERNGSTLHQFIFILGLVLLFLSAFPYPFAATPNDFWRGRLFAAGMFCWMLSTTV